MAAPDRVVNLAEKLKGFTEHWAPKTIAEFNGLHVKVVKVDGEFTWHDHPDTDEVFLVLSGRLRIDLEDAPPADLGPGELFVVPRGRRHRPVAERECELVLIEPAGVPNTGDAETAASEVWV